MNNKNNELKMDELENIKTKAFYEELIRSWTNTKMQHDKSIFVGSLVLISVHLVNIMIGGVNSNFEFIISSVSIILLAVCILEIIIIFDKNANLIKAIWMNKDQLPVLKKYDYIARYSFIIAFVWTILLFITK